MAFTDDDCYPDAKFADRISAAFSDPEIGFLSGRIDLFDTTDARVTIDERSTPWRYPAGGRIFAGDFHGANLAFRRKALEQVGGVDPLFGPGSPVGSAADIDAVGRVCRAGWAGKYDPEVVVRHHHGRKDGQLKPLFRQYAIGRGAYNAKTFLATKDFITLAHVVKRCIRFSLDRPSDAWHELIGVSRYLRARRQVLDVKRH